MKDNKCVVGCVDGKYLSEGKCLTCLSTCLTCANATTCNNCNKGLFLNLDKLCV